MDNVATKRMGSGLGRLLAVSPFAFIVACGPAPAQLGVKPPVRPAQPDTIVGRLSVDQIIIPTRPATPLQLSPGVPVNRITLTATNADVRELLPVLAAAAGISLVMTPTVKGRVNVYLRDVSALEALRAVINEAGLVVGEDEIPQPFSEAVFFQLPVNVNTASAATIRARFGVTDSTANWIVRGRTW